VRASYRSTKTTDESLVRFQILVDWKGDGSVYTEIDDIENFINLIQKELKIPFESRAEFLSEELFCAAISEGDFRCKLWPGVAKRLFALIDTERSGVLTPENIHAFFKKMAPALKFDEIRHLLREFKAKTDGSLIGKRLDSIEEDALHISDEGEFMRFFFSGVFGSTDPENEGDARTVRK